MLALINLSLYRDLYEFDCQPLHILCFPLHLFLLSDQLLGSSWLNSKLLPILRFATMSGNL